jgi:hypothetical protein
MAVNRIINSFIIGAGLFAMSNAGAAEDWLAQQLAISDGSNPIVHEAFTMSGAAGRRAAVDTSESSGFLAEQLALTDGSPYAVTNRGGSSKGPEGRRTESSYSASDSFFERQARLSDGSVD